MKKDLIEIIIILDKSGSMEIIKTDTICSYNKFIEEQKNVEGQVNITLVLFDHRYEVFCLNKNIKEVELLSNNSYKPDGFTALLYAVGKTIDDVGIRLNSTPENERPEKILVVILTDGEENYSRNIPNHKYARDKIFEMINNQTEIYKWSFLYLGANIDVFKSGKDLGINPVNTLSFLASSDGIKTAFTNISTRTTALRKSKITN